MAKQKRTLLKEQYEARQAIRHWKRYQMGQWHETQREINLWHERLSEIERELEERFRCDLCDAPSDTRFCSESCRQRHYYHTVTKPKRLAHTGAH